MKGIRIKNFLSSQCEKRYIPSNNDFYHENYGAVPVDTNWGREIEKILLLDSKEKALYGGSVFVKGKQNLLGSNRTAYVPLYIHELNLILENDVYFISVIDTHFNPDFIEMVNSIDENLNLTLDIISLNAPSNPFGFENSILLQKFIEINFHSWSTHDFENYQKADFDFESYFKKCNNLKTNSLKLLSCLMIGVFKKSEGSLGILTELNQLTQVKDRSPILEQFFQISDFQISELKIRNIYLPTTLSSNQESAFYATDAYPISQIIGPPGTGKSYTIAALAIDALSNNKSVLMVTRNTQACQVITNIIENDFNLKHTIIKAFNQRYKRSLIASLRKVVDHKFSRLTSPHTLKRKIDGLIKNIKDIEDQIIQVEKDEVKWGEFYAANKEGFFSKFKSKWIQYKKRMTIPIWKLNDSLLALKNEKIRLVKKYIKAKVEHNLHQSIKNRKEDFINLTNALKEKNRTILDEKLKNINFNLVLKALPLWATTTKEVSKNLPLQNGLFDVVIFDESSQCDIASVLPVLYRAQKIIVVGDPYQLRHISFLSDQKQNELKHKYAIVSNIADYRRDSLIDWTDYILSNPDQSTFLEEHFRSKTDLIQFSNQKFYNGKLKLIRSNPISDSYKSIEFIRSKGTRNAKGINDTEIQLLIEWVKEFTALYTNLGKHISPTLGIISPFAQQVKSIKKAFSQAITIDLIKKHKILIGTPFHFQGEERDIVLISLAIDKDSHYGSVNYLNRTDVFNVLVTRARNRQVVFTSFDSSKLPANSLLKEYLESSVLEEVKAVSHPDYDLFLEQVSSFLIEEGFDILHKSIIVSGVQIDLVLVNNGKYYCIDLIGYPGEFEDQFSLENLRILNRMKTPIFFLPYSNWYLDEDRSKSNLMRFINKKQ